MPEADRAGWEDPPRTAAATSPVLSVDGFEGPLDWLLELARAKKIDLTQLSILALIEAFADALEAALARPSDGAAMPSARPDLARCGEWMVAAAQLTELRSRLLLPGDAPDLQAAAAEAEALRRTWLLRARVAVGADWLERRPQLGVEVFGRGRGRQSDAGPLHESAGPEAQDGRETDTVPAEASSDAEDEEPVAGGDLTDLLRACLVMLRLPAGAEAWRPEPPKLWGPADAARRIRRLLDLQPAGAAFEAFLPSVPADAHGRALLCRGAVAGTFLAGLELARGDAAVMEQEESWSSIRIRAGEAGAS